MGHNSEPPPSQGGDNGCNSRTGRSICGSVHATCTSSARLAKSVKAPISNIGISQFESGGGHQIGRVVEPVVTTDLKSVVRKDMRVRSSPWPPIARLMKEQTCQVESLVAIIRPYWCKSNIAHQACIQRSTSPCHNGQGGPIVPLWSLARKPHPF